MKSVDVVYSWIKDRKTQYYSREFHSLATHNESNLKRFLQCVSIILIDKICFYKVFYSNIVKTQL